MSLWPAKELGIKLGIKVIGNVKMNKLRWYGHLKRKENEDRVKKYGGQRAKAKRETKKDQGLHRAPVSHWRLSSWEWPLNGVYAHVNVCIIKFINI